MQKKTNKQSVAGYYLLYGISYLHALLPLSVLYVLSDALYFFLYYIARYRRKVVRKNLTNAFPFKGKVEIEKIEKDFYRFLCDYYVETIKLLHISDEEVKQRMRFDNPELLNELAKNGNSCFMSLGHYGNWEYVPSVGFYLSPEIVQGQIYKQLHNSVFDRFFLKIRSRFSPKCIEMGEAFRTIVKNRNEGRSMLIGFINDQRPPRYYDQYWTTFLNQDTLVLTGMERIAAKFGFAVVYLDMQRVKRGYYRGTFSVITLDASKEEPYAVTEKYMRELEKTILRDPAYWLWSHNRWKFAKNTNTSA
ncbi:lysophospholipid acyltransferase family protein [Anaerorudis cellulosivorans]|jgi:KDO2-lipid IV(A) lauroyltransferase|uniref:lysophospholipid acyltransferase family protein n=1 Tax=Anaerorudis cellulosivorans TaxID=3397862 RepID=UPI0022207F80|nr:lysophospholipid acyltransferase family protein [Seramator thermalis]MCW1734872.1 lysophospholipid acyltransferase family protein [Seramator thermalis]